MREKTQNAVGFGLTRVITEQFAIIEEVPIDGNVDINVEVGIRFAIDPDKKIIAAYTLFKFELYNKTFLLIEAACHFAVEENAWTSFIEGQEIKFDKGFLCHLAMITVGTTRGILHAKTEGTRYNEYIIPTVNITEIIKEDHTFSLLQPA